MKIDILWPQGEVMNRTVRWFLLGFLFFSLIGFCDEQQAVNAILKDRVDTYAKTVGMVVGIVDVNGPRIYAAGKFCRKCDKAVDGDTVFEIGSITKVFTTLLLEEMVEEGRVKLEDPISEYLPKSVKVPTRNGKEITLVDLATQSSGLPRLPDNMKPADPGNPYADYTVQNMYDFLSGYTLTRDIGSQYEYSNFGMGLLGHILTLVAKKDYESLVVERICRPLGMDNTRITLTPQMKDRLATGHNAFLEPVPNWDLPALAGAGALRSSANDLLKFVSANLGLTRTSLSAEMESTQKQLRQAGSPEIKIGLAWHIINKYDSEIVFHDGGTGGYRSIIVFDRAKKTGVVVLSNSENDINDVGLHLLNSKYELAKFEAPKKGHVEVKIDSAILDAYIGNYQAPDGSRYSVTIEEDRLFLQPGGKSRVRLFAESETGFFAKLFDLQVVFDKDASGKVTGFTLQQNGASTKTQKQP